MVEVSLRGDHAFSDRPPSGQAIDDRLPVERTVTSLAHFRAGNGRPRARAGLIDRPMKGGGHGAACLMRFNVLRAFGESSK